MESRIHFGGNRIFVLLKDSKIAMFLESIVSLITFLKFMSVLRFI